MRALTPVAKIVENTKAGSSQAISCHAEAVLKTHDSFLHFSPLRRLHRAYLSKACACIQARLDRTLMSIEAQLNGVSRAGLLQ